MPRIKIDRDKVTGRYLPGHLGGVRHGGYLKTIRGVPLSVRRQVQGIREQLIRDIGGVEPTLTAAQTILIDKTVNLYQVTLCLEAYVRREGAFVGKKLDPVLGQNYLAFVNTIRLNLRELGINTRAGEKMLGPLEIAAEIDREQAELDAREAVKMTAGAALGGPESPVEARGKAGAPDTTGRSGNSTEGENDDRGGEDNG